MNIFYNVGLQYNTPLHGDPPLMENIKVISVLFYFLV